MGYRGHVTFGLLCYAATMWLLYSWGILGARLEYVVLGGVLAMVGAVLPDIDHPKSLVGQAVPRMLTSAFVLVIVGLVAVPYVLTGNVLIWEFMSVQMFALLALAPLVFALVPVVLYKAVGHRGPTHSLVVVFIVVGIGAIASSLTTWIVFGATCALAVGWASHVLADVPSGNGVMWLWPITERKLGGWGRRRRGYRAYHQ